MPLEQEPRLSFNVPSKWTNRFIAVGLPHGVRIATSLDAEVVSRCRRSLTLVASCLG